MTEPDDDFLDGCALDFTEQTTDDGDVDGVVMFADVAGHPAAVEQRRVDLIEWAAADA